MSIYKSGLDLMDEKVKKYKENKGVEYKETAARTAVKPPVEQKLNSVGITPSTPSIKKSNPSKKSISIPVSSTAVSGNMSSVAPPTPPQPKSQDNNLSPYDNITKWTQPKDTSSSPPNQEDLYKNINKWVIPNYKKPDSTTDTSTKPKGSSAFEIFSKSFMKRYLKDKYYADVYKDMLGQANNKDYYQSLIEGGFYDFTADSLGKKIAANASEFLGDQYLHYTDPRSLSAATGAASAAAVAGNASPLVAFPEELLTVPSAAMLGLKSGAAVSAYEAETGYIFDELTKNGISRENAKKIALGAGGINAGLEMIQVDDLLKSFKILKNSKKGGSIVKKTVDFLLKHIANASVEAGIDTLQEGVDITAQNTAAMLDDKDFTYEGARKRLTDTYKSSFPAYLLMGMAGDGINYALSNTLKNKPSTHAAPDTTPEASPRDINKLSDSKFEEYIRRIKDGDDVEDLFDKSYKKSSINSYNAPVDLPDDLFDKYLKRRTDGEEPEDMADLFEEARKRELTKQSENDIIEHNHLATAGSLFVNKKELLFKNAQYIKPIDDFYDVVCHANPDNFEIDLVGKGLEDDFIPVTPEEFAERIKNSAGYDGGNIRLISCQAGAKSDGAAQKIANILGKEVIAATENVNVDDDGNIFLTNNEKLALIWYSSSGEEKSKFKETGKWVHFYPQNKEVYK